MTDTPTSQRVYRDPISDRRDQVLFFGFFALGTISIWTLKSFGYNQYFVTGVPLALMVTYAVIALVTKRYRVREDRVGDNIYYLGFLFTLVSLAYALRIYNPDGSGATEIITNFGIAVFTTIFGLAGRVLFNQMRDDPVEYEREARASLADASRALRAELFGISGDLSSFKRSMLQITAESVTEVAASVKESMTTNVEQFAKTAQQVIGKIQLAFDSFSDHATQLNDMAEKNGEALEALFERIEKIEASPSLISEKLEPVIAKFHEIADEAARRNKSQTNDLKRVRDLIDAAVQASETLRGTLSAVDAGLRERLSTFGTSLEATAGLADRFAHTLDAASTAVTTELTNAAALAKQLTESMNTQQSSLADVKTAVASELDQIRQYRAEMAKMAEESSAAVKLVQSSLVSLSKNMVEQLSGGHRAS